MELERRFSAGAAVEGRQLVGLAAPFGAETRIGDFREIIAPGAFSRTLSESADILALVDHDESKVLGRTRSGSLELRETPEGLEYRLTLPDTSAANDLRALAKRGDLGGVSFGFRVVRDSWAGDLRTLHEVELHEISIVQAHPAYPTTTVSLRSRVGYCPRLNLARRYLEAVA
ncbi:TPA: HK97 family phage prohead protease [Pseudomonas aeruginosa]|uniref:HK97 family phage prohead protease n=1 Tax=Pseudomonas TaxID=286 RepID=UPI00053EEECC|nr:MULTISPECIES: HK97 family phage prohead protease [Pseudomonas]EKU2896358.1 HK97 family phage prohead protease [Pseudomonas aeruginosa]ELR2936128.1 HK97 family phage prohead protease [Pseudomonas aeruginosa]EMD5191757.1 HK97 family phage prohead protease [Pseudomonas aeruginosa]MBG4378584.1 HK97 family phage prohead protease [Pseudomonas aeruginosa]MBG7335087.1 HK97 family phage prohead protease [Pseudomonas aeruginosa]